MARVTHVKHARQRYKMRPVIDPATGQPKRVPVLRTRDGQPRLTKRGTPIFQTITEPDKSQPLPVERCGRCQKPIEVGDPYKWIAPKSGPYGGRRLVRCATCPTWQRWEYSQSLSARIEHIQHDTQLALDDATDPDDVRSALTDAAEEIRSLAEEKRESASNIESGFGHETEQSTELNDQADQLESWADEVENADVPDLPEPEEIDCEACGGDGTVPDPEDERKTTACESCDGIGQITPDEPTDDQMDTWRDEVHDAVSIVDEAPV